MTQIDQIIADALAGSPENYVAILAREVVRLREAQFVVIPQDCGTCGSYQDIGGDPHKCSGCSGSSFPNWNRSRSLAHVHSIPAERVLGEGMVQVDPGLLMLLDKGLESCKYAPQHVLREAIRDALRTNQGGADHA